MSLLRGAFFGVTLLMLAGFIPSAMAIERQAPRQDVQDRVLFRATVRLEEPNKQDNAILDPIVVLRAGEYRSPLDNRAEAETFLTPKSVYDMTQSGLPKGRITPKSILSSEHCDNGLMTASAADIPSSASVEYEEAHRTAVFLVDSATANSAHRDEVPKMKASLPVTDSEKAAVRQRVMELYRAAGYPQTALDRITVEAITKRDVLNNGQPVLIASVVMPLPEGGSGEPDDDHYNALSLIVAPDAHASQGLRILWQTPLQNENNSEMGIELYSLVETLDIDHDGVQELVFQQSWYYSDGGLVYKILGWRNGAWVELYSGGGNTGC